MARRRYYRRRRRYRRNYRRSFRRKAIASTPYLIGAGASFIPQVGAMLPAQANAVITALAVAPSGIVRGRVLGRLKAGCQGYVAGKVLQSFIGNPLAGFLGGGRNGGSDPSII